MLLDVTYCHLFMGEFLLYGHEPVQLFCNSTYDTDSLAASHSCRTPKHVVDMWKVRLTIEETCHFYSKILKGFTLLCCRCL